MHCGAFSSIPGLYSLFTDNRLSDWKDQKFLQRLLNVLWPTKLPPISSPHEVVIFKKIFLFISLFLAVLDLCCWKGFSLVAASGGYFPVAVHRLLIVLASLVAEHGLQGMQAPVVESCGLSNRGSQAQSTGSIVMVHGIDCPMAYRIFPDQGSDTCLLHWQDPSPEKPHKVVVLSTLWQRK